MPRVLITPVQLIRNPGPCQAILEAAGFEIVYPPPGKLLLDPELLRQHLVGVDAMLASIEPLSRDILSASSLRVVARVGVGYDTVDVLAATELGIPVTIAPNTNHESVAEHTIAMILSLARGLTNRDRAVRSGLWQRQPLPRLAGRTLGIVGLGRIGRAVARRARALELSVVAYDPFCHPEQAHELGVSLLRLDELLASADIVSLHLPLTAETKQLLDSRRLAMLKPSAILINTSRGGLIDEAALCETLDAGRLAAVGLDTFAIEPLPHDSPLRRQERILFTPHVAGIDEESIRDMSRMAAQCVVDLSRGQWPAECVVNPQTQGHLRPW